jgi:low temperature requirement protein LtrA
MDERRTTTVELLWDLVFVFAVTQVTTLLAADLNWIGFARAMLVLALIWWAWSAFVWATNAEEETSRAVTVVLLVGMIAVFICGLALPRAFASEATLFASSYAVVRLLHLGLYADASHQGNAAWSAIAGFTITVLIGIALLIVGSFTSGAARYALWGAAVAIDYAGPGWLTRDRLRDLQQVAVAHFAERYGQFVLICLGESIVAISVAAGAGDRRPLTPALLTAVVFALLIIIAMWWTYFDRFAAGSEKRLRGHDDPVLAAVDAYSYVHLLIVAGIIIFAVGLKVARGSVTAPLPDAARLAFTAGIALYLIGQTAVWLRLHGKAPLAKLITAAALMVLYAAGGDLAAWVVAGIAAVLIGGLAAFETAGTHRHRSREAVSR